MSSQLRGWRPRRSGSSRWRVPGWTGAATSRAFVKNEFLGFAIPYIHNGQDHEYYPDYLVRLRDDPPFTLIMEVKGRPDPLEQVKAEAAHSGWTR